jgi:hypothetical protein
MEAAHGSAPFKLVYLDNLRGAATVTVWGKDELEFCRRQVNKERT